MGRKHLFEFEDQPWFPRLIRAYMQDHLTFMASLTSRPYQGFVEKLKTAMDRLGQRELLDLCSGSGGPAWIIVRLLRSQGLEVNGRVSDLFPNLVAYRYLETVTDGVVRGVDYPVDAANVPTELKGFRLVANGFHHLPPQQAVRVLADAVAKQQGIAVVEMVSRSLPAFFSVGAGVILTFLAAPFIKPFRLSRLFFTYLAPLVPFCLLWDGIVSCLRVYSPAELREVVSQLKTDEYHWDIGALRPGPGVVTYLIGIPDATPQS